MAAPDGPWWPLRFPGRLMAAAEIALLPLRAAALALEVAVLGAVAAGLGAGIAAFSGRLPASGVRAALEAAGSACLAILKAQGVY